MNGSGAPNRERPPRAAPSADEEWADAYAEGYGEGLREALREMLQHASRGHTAQELRLLIESRMARLKEDIDLKRKSLLAPPRRASYGSLFRPPAPLASGSGAAQELPRAERGSSYLIFEERPSRALDILRGAAVEFPRVVVVSFHPPELSGVDPAKLQVLSVAVPGVVGAGPQEGLSAQEIAGRIRAASEAVGGALVYLDALEVMATGGPPENLVRFVQWVANQVSRTRSVLIASVGPRSFDDPVKSQLQRAFNKFL